MIVSLDDRILAEDLMSVWAACHDSERMRADPSFDDFDVAARNMLIRLGMEWDVSHGYVFPWTDRSSGPFPMSKSRR